jgi:hypothetical protein
MLADITIGDALELMDREAEAFTCPTRDHKVFYRMLRELRGFGSEAPQRLRAFRTAGQLTPEELVDRYQLQSRPVRDLLVDYLRERQPAMDYTSLKNLPGADPDQRDPQLVARNRSRFRNSRRTSLRPASTFCSSSTTRTRTSTRRSSISVSCSSSASSTGPSSTPRTSAACTGV